MDINDFQEQLQMLRTKRIHVMEFSDFAYYPQIMMTSKHGFDSALLALNYKDFPHKYPVVRTSEVSVVIRMNRPSNKLSRWWLFDAQ